MNTATAAAAAAASVISPSPCKPPQSAKIFGDGVWFKTNAAALTPEGANILGLSFGLGNNLPALFVSTVSLFACFVSSAVHAAVVCLHAWGGLTV
jgi:hypothetical protein